MHWQVEQYLDGFEANLGVLTLSLQLKLNVKKGDFWAGVRFWLHLEASVRESFLEGNAGNEESVLKRNKRVMICSFVLK